MSSQASTKRPAALWKVALATFLLFILINFVFEATVEAIVEAMQYDIHGYYPLTRIVIMLLTIAGAIIYHRKAAK